MAVEQGLLQLIRADQTTASLVQLANGKGIYWILAPKGSLLPFIVLSRVATSDEYTVDGPVGFRNALFQVDCYGDTYYKARAVADAVRDALWSYSGTMPDSDATVVNAVLVTKDWDMPYEEGSAPVGFIYRTLLEFRVFYRVSS